MMISNSILSCLTNNIHKVLLLTCVLEINSSEKKKIKPVLTCYLQKVFIRLIFWLWKLGLGPWMVDHFDLCMCLSTFLFILVSKSELYIIQGLILWWVFCWNSCVVALLGAQQDVKSEKVIVEDGVCCVQCFLSCFWTFSSYGHHLVKRGARLFSLCWN